MIGMDGRSLAAALLALLPLSLGGCASSGRTAAAELTEVEHRWVEALRTHDTAALDDLLADGFVDSTFRGETRTKREVLAGPAAGGAYRSLRLDDLAVRTYGSTAVVTGVNVLRGPAGDEARVRFTDVFIRRHGRWRAVSAQETLQSARPERSEG
jgi:ketosteroid isomerase-like protein